MNIFFDLDGTLLDSRKRMYVLFKKLVEESEFSFEEYWWLKRNKVNHKTILEKYYPEINFLDFEKTWMNSIESEELLCEDMLYEGATLILEKLKSNNRMYILTARQNKKNLFKQLDKLNITRFFVDILPTEHKTTKEQILKSRFALMSNDIIIGDTGYDIVTGKNVGIRTIAISHGFLSKEVLGKYEPDFLIDNLMEIGGIIPIKQEE